MHSICDDVIENVSAWPGAVHAGETPTHSIERYIGSGQLDSLRGVVVIAYGVYTIHTASPPLCDGGNLNDRGKRQHVNVYASVSNLIIVF